MKKIIIFIWLVLISFSCGSIKKDKSSFEKDSETNTELKTSNESSKYTLKDGYSFEPIDLSKPMIHGTEKYYNTKIVNNREIIHEKSKDTVSINQNKNEKLDIDEKHKETDNTWLFIGIAIVGMFCFLFFVIIILIALYFYLKK